jgi:hypothetical protein
VTRHHKSIELRSGDLPGRKEGETSAMMQFVRQMLKLPLTVLVSSMEVVVQALRGFQRIAEESIDTMVSEDAPHPSTPPERGNPHSSAVGTVPANTVNEGATTDHYLTETEECEMGDPYNMTSNDLGGEELKVVRWRVIFTKKDREVTLEHGEEVVNYPTSGGSFGGLKVAEFFVAASQGLRNPARDRLTQSGYTDTENLSAGWTIKRDDQKYINFTYEVLERVPVSASDYDRQQVEVLRDIRDKL